MTDWYTDELFDYEEAVKLVQKMHQTGHPSRLHPASKNARHPATHDGDHPATFA
jgi:hypothetical protein